jgi:hypothetical protein
MQTFLPIATTDFSQIAKTLDNKRLNKQALEAWQILMILTQLDPQGNERVPKGWVGHPAVKMWDGSGYMLYMYTLAMTHEWIERGYKSTIPEKATLTLQKAIDNGTLIMGTPQWIQDVAMFEKVASTHRQALLVKDYGWYSQFNWEEDNGQPPTEYQYIWPV